MIVYFFVYSVKMKRGYRLMKRILAAAYAALLITLAMAFYQERLYTASVNPTPRPPAKVSVSVTAGPRLLSTDNGAGTAAEADTAPAPPAAAPQAAPETLRVKHAGEVYEVNMQDYLTGVVAAEMPAGFGEEALKAQAVAARSYALYCAATGRHEDADVCTDYRCCQAWSSADELRESWGGDSDANMAKIRAAVDETFGEYLCYGGEPVFAAFHSSSAGMTEDCGAIWSARPYLVSVPSPEDEDSVPGYISSVDLSPLDFRDTVLYAHPEADFTGEKSGWIGAVELDESGRVSQVVLGGVPMSGTEIRSLFSLRSTAFTLEYTGASFLFTVTGYGHGVGMSQYGANVMAENGTDYRGILAHYYPGTELVK